MEAIAYLSDKKAPSAPYSVCARDSGTQVLHGRITWFFHICGKILRCILYEEKFLPPYGAC